MGRSEQGISQALSVEKTSKRGGRIVHERDLMPPPSFFGSLGVAGDNSATPPHIEESEYGEASAEEAQQQAKPSITDILKNPTKVVLCKVRTAIPS